MGSVSSLAFSADGSLLAMSGSSFDEVARNWGPIESGGGETRTRPGRPENCGTSKQARSKHDLVGHSHAIAGRLSLPTGTPGERGKLGFWPRAWQRRDHLGSQSGKKLRALTKQR